MALFSSKEPASTPSRPGEPQPAFHGTYLGPNVVIDGTVSGSEAVVVEGAIKGRINVTNDLRIGTKARVEATVHAKNATVEGKLKAPKIVVAEGARFRGSVDMGSAKPKTTEKGS